MSKFFDNEEEHVKKLNYFDPEKRQEDLNLYQMKIVKKDLKKEKKSEQSKSVEKLKKSKYLNMLFNSDAAAHYGEFKFGRGDEE